MPVGATIGAAVIGGGVNLIGQNEAANTQQQAAQQAAALQAQQLAAQQAQQNYANQAAQYQYQVQQAELAPYLAAHNAVLAKYGVPIPASAAPPTPPPGWVGAGAQPTTAGGVLGANPLLAKYASGSGFSGGGLPVLPLAGIAALGAGTGYLGSTLGNQYQAVPPQQQLGFAGASQPANLPPTDPYSPAYQPTPSLPPATPLPQDFFNNPGAQ